MAPDTGTLAWVKDEIDLALEQASEALARHAASPAEARPLAEAREFVHQASGALAIVGVKGASRLCAAIEARLAELAASEDAREVVAVAAAAGAAMAALRRYLDELMAGHPDQALKLFPAYRALLLAAGRPEPSPRELFFPDLTQRPPRRTAEVSPLTPARAKAMRLGFARGLAKWRAQDARGLVEMKNAIAAIEQGFREGAERALWWIAAAWFEAILAAKSPAPDEALLAALDEQCERLAEGRWTAEAPPETLLAGLLYDLAVTPAHSELIKSVRAAYRLAELIPTASLGGETQRAACRAPLATAMAEWERFDQGSAIALMRFAEVTQLLAEAARQSQDAELARLSAAIVDFAAWLRQKPERFDHAMALEVASALVLFEEASEGEGARAPAEALLLADEVSAQIGRLDRIRATGSADLTPPPPRRWREARLVSELAREIGAELAALEAALEAFFRSPADTAPLPGAAARLKELASIFTLIEEEAAARLAASLAGRVAALASGAAGDFAELAEDLAALAQFADALRRGQPERSVLARAEGLLAEKAVLPAPSCEASPAGPVATKEDELIAIFLEEAREVLATLAATQPRLAQAPEDDEALLAIRRDFHTLKGSGRMVGLAELADAAHAVERVLNRQLERRTPADAELLALLEAARQAFADWVEALAAGEPAPAADALLARCQARLGESPAASPAPGPATAAASPAQVSIGVRALPATLWRRYVEEAQGHLAALRRELTGPAGIPSRALIRDAHTLAGISASAGFAPVHSLAQALEKALVHHALAQTPPLETTRMLFARAVGALEGMIGAIAQQRAPAEEAALIAALAALAPAPAADLSPLAERRMARPDDEIDPALAALFLEEADEKLAELEAALAAWRANPREAGLGQHLARLLHTFKGDARMCGAMGVGELAHAMETRIEEALADAGQREAVIEGLKAALGRAHELVARVREQAAMAAQQSAPAAAPPPQEGAPAVLLRVRAELIDHLVDEAGELASARGRLEGSVKAIKGALIDLAENVSRLQGQLREFEILAEASMPAQLVAGEAARRDFDPLELDRFTRLQELTRMMAESVADVATVEHALRRQSEVAGEALASQSRHTRELSHALLRARMLPFATIADRLHRVVRQTAKELGREAQLELEGEETALDRHVLERLVGPLEHLLRNAVAHGIEPPEARRAVGKPGQGEIRLAIAQADNEIVLTLEDDGAGLDYAAIRARALARGHVAAEASEEELAELIFRPGFTTAETVSEIAGRGIGLDVVKSEVGQLGGRIDVSSEAGHGARFRIVLPMTLAMMPVMLVTAAGRPWAIPAAMVEEARELGEEEAAARRAAGALTVDGRHYPWHSLPRLYGLPEEEALPRWQLLLKSGGASIALEAASLTQKQEVVVKPLGKQLSRVPGLAGATVLPEGRVALIVNPVALAQRAVLPRPTLPARPAADAPAAPRVLVVDDSLTVRKITGRLLERAGYRVQTAKDGVEALERLEHERPAVILADIEMPRMDGFELVRHLRADQRFAALPVIMIPSRIADKHRQVAAELGVRHYLGKPYDEGELLSLIAALTKT
ncbi:MAG: Hpt domain-containing protein [Rhodocyclaceae bacterium]|nr:Hpt domain-containing protein [Rhodocyclaceae bacterium]